MYAQASSANDAQAIGNSLKSCCHRCNGDHKHSRSDLPGQCKVECKGICQYIGPEKIELPPKACAFVELAVISAAVTSSATGAVSRHLWSEAVFSEPPLRLHLLNQILLI